MVIHHAGWPVGLHRNAPESDREQLSFSLNRSALNKIYGENYCSLTSEMVYLHGRDQFARYNDPFIHLFLNSRVTARMEEQICSPLSLSLRKKRKRKREGEGRRGEVSRRKDGGSPWNVREEGRARRIYTRMRYRDGRLAGMVENYRYGIGISDSLRARGRANSCHSSGQGVLQRYIPCRCSVFSLGTPFFATRAKGGYASCHCVHRRPPLFSKDRIPIHVAFSLRPSIPSRSIRSRSALLSSFSLPNFPILVFLNQNLPPLPIVYL